MTEVWPVEVVGGGGGGGSGGASRRHADACNIMLALAEVLDSVEGGGDIVPAQVIVRLRLKLEAYAETYLPGSDWEAHEQRRRGRLQRMLINGDLLGGVLPPSSSGIGLGHYDAHECLLVLGDVHDTLALVCVRNDEDGSSSSSLSSSSSSSSSSMMMNIRCDLETVVHCACGFRLSSPEVKLESELMLSISPPRAGQKICSIQDQVFQLFCVDQAPNFRVRSHVRAARDREGTAEVVDVPVGEINLCSSKTATATAQAIAVSLHHEIL